MWQRSRIKFPTQGRPGSFQFLLDIPSSQTFRLTLWIVAADNELGEIRLITDLQVSGEVLTHTHTQVLTAHRKDSSNDIKVKDTFSAVIIKLVDCSMEEKKKMKTLSLKILETNIHVVQLAAVCLSWKVRIFKRHIFKQHIVSHHRCSQCLSSSWLWCCWIICLCGENLRLGFTFKVECEKPQ